MPNLFDWLFKEGQPAAELYHDKGDVIHAAFGGVGIALFFSLLGLVFILLSGHGPKKIGVRSTARISFSKLTGVAFLICSLSRGVEVMAIWHHYPHLVFLLRDLTCIAAASASIMLIPVVAELRQQKTLNEVHEKMEETVKKLEEVKQLNNEVSNLK